ncbi:hypothetical protein JTE90_027682 [Oedothorax gibbosus]|uniref:Uncharacterized protein n=1 Tax=Oedothorax gibbosus TaxID=931172 RepID=A0AAV6TKG6_9ARAC|nr:hypothetical protein JTE90_027682 [Oedothorax gibbosus]
MGLIIPQPGHGDSLRDQVLGNETKLGDGDGGRGRVIFFFVRVRVMESDRPEIGTRSRKKAPRLLGVGAPLWPLKLEEIV